MIARVSRAKQLRLLPVCRVKRCRSAATETLNPGHSPFWCTKHLRWALELA